VQYHVDQSTVKWCSWQKYVTNNTHLMAVCNAIYIYIYIFNLYINKKYSKETKIRITCSCTQPFGDYRLSGSKRHQTLSHIFFIYIIYRITKLKEKTMHVHITTVCHTLHALLTLHWCPTWPITHAVLASASSSIHSADVVPSTIVCQRPYDPYPW